MIWREISFSQENLSEVWNIFFLEVREILKSHLSSVPRGGLWWHFCIGVSLNPHHRFGRLITVFSFLPVEKQDRLYSKPGLLDSKVANTTCSALPIKYRTVSNSFHYSFNDYFRTIILYMPIFRACWPNNSLFSLRV